METKNISRNKKPFFILWILCIIGIWSVIPYTHHLAPLPVAVSMWKILLLGTVQGIVFFGLICWLSFKIVPKTDLDPFSYQNFLKQIAYPGIISGLVVGGAIFFFDKTIFRSSLLSEVHPPLWTGALASIYGGVNEEVLLRLFLFSFIYFIFGKAIKIRKNNRPVILWSVNIIVALLFGMSHLPAAFKLASPSGFEIFRVLFLNGLAGLVFGWLYWSRGLWAAITAHIVADLMIHVFLI